MESLFLARYYAASCCTQHAHNHSRIRSRAIACITDRPHNDPATRRYHLATSWCCSELLAASPSTSRLTWRAPHRVRAPCPFTLLTWP